MPHEYPPGFFAHHATGSSASADRILPDVLRLLRPRSVVDVGCGTGTWLAAAARLGVEDVLGVDGEYVDRSALEIPAACFRPADLNRPLALGRGFDLALSLEVAEHLPPDRAASFVADLVALAPAVLFSAAVPWQGGTHHVNEQWQDHWVALFAAAGYRAYDCVRGRVWNDPDVAFWYAQNTFLFVRESADDACAAAREEERLVGSLPVRVVHPTMYRLQNEQREAVAAAARPWPTVARRVKALPGVRSLARLRPR